MHDQDLSNLPIIYSLIVRADEVQVPGFGPMNESES